MPPLLLPLALLLFDIYYNIFYNKLPTPKASFFKAFKTTTEQTLKITGMRHTFFSRPAFGSFLFFVCRLLKFVCLLLAAPTTLTNLLTLRTASPTSTGIHEQASEQSIPIIRCRKGMLQAVHYFRPSPPSPSCPPKESYEGLRAAKVNCAFCIL